MTPRELLIYIEGYQSTVQQRNDALNGAIYNLACLIRLAVWGKDEMPTYRELFKPDETEGGMSDQALFNQVLALNRMFGGSVETDENSN